MKTILYLAALAATFVTLTAAPAQGRPDPVFLATCLKNVQNVMVSTALTPAFSNCAQAIDIDETLVKKRILFGTDSRGRIEPALSNEPRCYKTWYGSVVIAIRRMPLVNGKVCTLNQPWFHGLSSVLVSDFNWQFEDYINYANEVVNINTKPIGRSVHLRTWST
ncbi:Aste57867_614 [Aphanomyces stellatus]|uniref:Aste57867_614 protein n=1 Tax=Aphanomyces stellatus TaxID=120398 RepID=A0A485K8A0_9STRA|nr:hypothetical protein As57867_000613 [Aphanomyces stellatus]VFT77839.1 Aste57867_614 [Aphanomyces stellatus]